MRAAASAAIIYTNLTLSGSGTKTPAAGFTTNNNFTIDSGVTLDVAALTLTFSTGTMIVNGTLDFTDSTGNANGGGGGGSTLTMIGTTTTSQSPDRHRPRRGPSLQVAR